MLEQSQESRVTDLEEFGPTNNYNRIIIAYYWIHIKRVDLVQRLL